MTSLRIRADGALSNAVVTGTLPAGAIHPGTYTYGDERHPAQVTQISNGSLLVAAYIAAMGAGESAVVELTPAQESSRGIELLEQPENGRIVVNYSGFLQTIYHYGAMNFKPRFYPIAVPCARMGGFDDPQTVYPKSITDDSPPDHIWHRSLWYACGDVNGIDFYLENGGEGRTVHRRFVDVFSGPVIGGFTQDLAWVTPEGRDLIADRRTFTHYRLKGALRMFDIGATFTALSEPVTFGQTNENALPLIRVADIVDEWDGGKITLSDGKTSGRDCFAQRAEWADCTGEIVDKPSGEKQMWGIAMLDHPTNRNHPNAWFARSYGPLGTNLPFFDGPLTLEPGESWELRHRIIVHEKDPWDAGIPQRFEEYAKPGTIEAA